MSEYVGGGGRHIEESIDCLHVGLVSHEGESYMVFI